MFESCYWHCYAKWKFDEDIALYEDETTEKKISRQTSQHDNLAFWDSVSMIANRSAIIMQPSPSKLSLYQQDEPITFIVTTPSQETDFNKIKETSSRNLTDEEKYIKINDITDEPKKKYRKKSAIEELIDKKTLPNGEKERKKSLKERRNSTADLTLDLSCKDDNEFHEIPIIRQDSVPKFFLNYTPEYNPFAESNVLTSPMVSQSPKFDLKSVVQIEKEIEQATQVKRISSRMANIRRKMAPILIKKGSTKSLPDSINHI